MTMLVLMLKSRALAVAMRLVPHFHTSCRPSLSIHDFLTTSVSEIHGMTRAADSRDVVSIGNGDRASRPRGIVLAVGFSSTEEWGVVMFLRFALTFTVCSLKSFLLGSRPFSFRVLAHSVPPLAAYFRSNMVSMAYHLVSRRTRLPPSHEAAKCSQVALLVLRVSKFHAEYCTSVWADPRGVGNALCCRKKESSYLKDGVESSVEGGWSLSRIGASGVTETVHFNLTCPRSHSTTTA